MGTGRLGGRKSLLDRRLWSAVGEVLPDRAAEEERFLEYHPQLFMQVVHRQIADVDPIHRDAPLLHVMKP